MKYVICFLQILLLWFAFSGVFDRFFLCLALISSLITSIIWLHFFSIKNKSSKYSIIRLLLYFCWLYKEILLSSFNVAKIIWSKKNDYEPFFCELDTKLQDKRDIGLFANSITLTPGTLTVKWSGNKLIIHSLVKNDFQSLITGEMEKNIAELKKV